MKCEVCSASIQEGKQHDHLGRILCDDCYMDALSPARTCDPWAVHSAKSFSKTGFNFGSQLNETQKSMLRILEQTGGMEPKALAEKLHLKESDFQREIATLRHMEMIRAEMRNGKKIIRLW
jgi:hypothetical protein